MAVDVYRDIAMLLPLIISLRMRGFVVLCDVRRYAFGVGKSLLQVHKVTEAMGLVAAEGVSAGSSVSSKVLPKAV